MIIFVVVFYIIMKDVIKWMALSGASKMIVAPLKSFPGSGMQTWVEG